MGTVAGGALAAAVSGAGGLGVLGVGYGDRAAVLTEFDRAAGSRVGCGFITWLLAERPHLLDVALQREPAMVTLSTGGPEPFATRIRAAGVPLVYQVSGIAEAHRALADGADVLVAQGSGGGGPPPRCRSPARPRRHRTPRLRPGPGRGHRRRR